MTEMVRALFLSTGDSARHVVAAQSITPHGVAPAGCAAVKWSRLGTSRSEEEERMTTVSADFLDGSKRQVAELKFLIHDLRVEKTINNIIHFHVTLNTDLEIYDIEQAHAFHSDDLAELKVNAAKLRHAFRDYSNAVRNFSPDKLILATGRDYIETIQEICELILNPLWGRFDRVISFLPDDSRSVQSRSHYRNNLRWICGIYYRIEYFVQELDDHDLSQTFDVGYDVLDYTNSVIYGYIVERSKSRVEIQVDREGASVVDANRARFRRMYFNLIMNAVDAMTDRAVGMISVSIQGGGDETVFTVSDNGSGMYPDKIANLLMDRDSLDGELHSLGFLFVRQTVTQMGGTLEVDSEIDKGTKVTIRLPVMAGHEQPPRVESRCQQYAVMPFEKGFDSHVVVVAEDSPSDATAAPPPRVAEAVAKAVAAAADASSAGPALTPGPFKPTPSRQRLAVTPEPGKPEVDGNFDRKDRENNLGRILHLDYAESEAEFPGSVFAIGLNYDLTIDTFMHKPYESHWNISHEDLSPMLYDATIRGRLEDDDDRAPQLILKEPHSVASYFDLKGVETRSKDRFIDMVHDEYVLIVRKLLATGLPAGIPVHLTSASKFFPGFEAKLGPEPFSLQALAEVALSTE